MTNSTRYILRPMEKLYKISRGSIEPVEVQLDNSLDLSYKPGLYRLTQSFLNNDLSAF